MKHNFIISLLLLSSIAQAQNIQLHYDFGKTEDGNQRNFPVGTFEMFRPDSQGLTFMFIDFEFDSPDKPRSSSSTYFEISREFYLPFLKNSKNFNQLAIHIEYNDGLYLYKPDSTVYGSNVRSSWLAGLGYPVKLGGFTLNTVILYKYLRESAAPDFQLTLAWFHMILKNRVTLSGFMDFWQQDDFFGNPDNKILVVYGEPQIWFNATSKLAIGSEFKISKNFVYGSNRVEVFPTLGAKLSF